MANKPWFESECLDDWRVDEIKPGKVPGFVFGGVFGQQPSFGGALHIIDSTRCGLQPGETYYLNLIYTSTTPSTLNDQIQSSCTNLRCGNTTLPALTCD